MAGIGNIFNRDDGFGSEVVRRLAGRPRPEGVHVEDYGIRGVHLAYELLEGYDLVVLVDAVPRGEAPGTVFVLEPEVDLDDAPPVDSHQMDPRAVLGMVAGLGGEIGRLLLVGCEPADVGEGMGLSPPVAAAVEEAARAVEEILAADHRRRSEAEADHRRRSEAEADHRRRSEAEADHRRRSEAEADHRRPSMQLAEEEIT